MVIGYVGNDEGRAKLAGRDDRVEEPFRGWVDLRRGSKGCECESEPLRAKRVNQRDERRVCRS